MADDVSVDLSTLDFASVTPEEFARIVRGLSAREFDELARGELRTRALHEVFTRMEQRFRPEKAGQTDALVRWRITGESELVYETAIANGTCTVREGRSEAEPRVTLTMSDAEFLRLASGNGNPVTMFVTRKLKVAGDIAVAARLSHLFDIPKA